MRFGAGARVVPIAVLVAMGAAVLAMRVRVRPKTLQANAASMMQPTAVRTSEPPGLGGPLEKTARAIGKGARMLHGDAQRTHRAAGKLPRAPKVAWTFAATGPIVAQPISDGETIYVGSHDGTLTALSKSGDKKWSVPLGDRIYATPCLADDGTIYVGSDAKRFFALTPDGKTKWRFDTDGDADTGAVIGKDGQVIFAAGATLYALRSSGDVAWRFKAKKKIFTAPALLDDGTVVVGSQDDHVYAVKPNGALAWTVDAGADVDGSPVVFDDGSMAVGTDASEILRIKPSGEIVWRAKTGGFVRGPLSLTRGGDVLAGVYGPTPRALRVAPDGTVRGGFPIVGTGAKEFGVHGGALEDDEGALAFGGQDNTIYVVEPSGALRWKHVTGGDVDAPLTLLPDGRLLAASEDGTLYVFSASGE